MVTLSFWPASLIYCVNYLRIIYISSCHINLPDSFLLTTSTERRTEKSVQLHVIQCLFNNSRNVIENYSQLYYFHTERQ